MRFYFTIKQVDKHINMYVSPSHRHAYFIEMEPFIPIAFVVHLYVAYSHSVAYQERRPNKYRLVANL